MLNIKNRLKEYLYTNKISKLQFYKNINVSNGYLDKDGSINSYVLGTIINKYPELNIYWLLFGNDSIMLLNIENVKPYESNCDEKCKIKDYIINSQNEKITNLKSKLN